MRVDQQRFTPKEVAELLGVSEAWLCRRRKPPAGQGPDFFNFGYRYFYYKDDIDRWRESRRNAGQIQA